MKLRSSLGAVALSSVCALPLTAGVLTINFTETGGNVVVTASGSLTDSSAWGSYNSGPIPSLMDPVVGYILFGGGGVIYRALGSNTGSWTGGFGSGMITLSSSFSGDPLGFDPANGDILLPSAYAIGITSTPLSSTMTFNAKTFALLGISPVAQTAVFGGDTIHLTFGASPVPDAGPGPALALLLGGFGLRQRLSSRRARAAA